MMKKEESENQESYIGFKESERQRVKGRETALLFGNP